MQEAVSSIIQISGVLASAADSAKMPAAQGPGRHAASAAKPTKQTCPAPETASAALVSCIERACNPGAAGAVGPANAVALLRDVAILVQLGRSAVVLALNDLQQLFLASSGLLTQDVTDRVLLSSQDSHTHLQIPDSKQQDQHKHAVKQQKQWKRLHAMILRKLLFMLSWANELPATVYDSLHITVLDELQQQTELQKPDTHDNGLDLRSDSFVGSMLESEKHSLPHRPVIALL